MLNDLKHALRTLVKSGGFSTIAVLILALGIAGATLMFGLLKKLAIEPLPYPAPDRIVQLWETDIGDTAGVGQMPLSVPDYLDLREQNRSFVDLAGFTADSVTVGGDSPEQIGAATCTVSLARVLGVQPALGRWFNETEEKPGASRVVVVTHALWQRRFAADASIIGQPVIINGQKHTLIGVLPPGVTLHSSWTREGPFEIYRPLVLNPARSTRQSHWLGTLARLKPGVTAETASAELADFGSRLAKAFPESNARVKFRFIPLARQVFGGAVRTAVIQQAAVSVVLLLACANVAGMLLARAARRQPEIAVRTALGATRWHIFRSLLAESALLSAFAAVLGILLTHWGAGLLDRIAPDDLLARGPVQLDAGLILFAIALAGMTTALAGLPPMLAATRTDLLDALKLGGPAGTGSRSRLRPLRWLVVGQIALTLLLTDTALLLSASYRNVIADCSAFVTDRVLTAQVNLVGARYRTAASRIAVRNEYTASWRTLPGVTAVATTSKLPFEGGNNTGVLVDDQVFDPNASRIDVELSTVSPDYFAAAGIARLRGRGLVDGDAATTPQGVLVNRAFAEHFWPGRDPLGRILRQNAAKPGFTAQVIGVVEDVRQWGAEYPAIPEIYFPVGTEAPSALTFVLRSSSDTHALLASLRDELHRRDPNLALAHVRTLREIVDDKLQLRRFQMLVLDAFMAIALLLAAVGIYGTLAFHVTAHTREIGVRVALGATSTDVARLVANQTAGCLITGALAGIAVSAAAATLLRAVCYGTAPLHPGYLAVATGIVGAAAGFAAWAPTRRALLVNPVEALRAE